MWKERLMSSSLNNSDHSAWNPSQNLCWFSNYFFRATVFAVFTIPIVSPFSSKAEQVDLLQLLFLCSYAQGNPQLPCWPQSAPLSLSISHSFLFQLSHLITIPFTVPTLLPRFLRSTVLQKQWLRNWSLPASTSPETGHSWSLLISALKLVARTSPLAVRQNEMSLSAILGEFCMLYCKPESSHRLLLEGMFCMFVDLLKTDQGLQLQIG